MHVRVLASPFAGAFGLGERISDHLANEHLTRLTAAIAWARRSGVARIADDLRRFRGRGGTVEFIVGIDEGGATLEGLNLIRELADRAWIFHDPQGGTFHPKAYVFRGPSTAVAVIGSANLTRGGLYSNYEVSLELELDLPADRVVLEDIDRWVAQIRSEPELCLDLNDALLGKILESGAARAEDNRDARPTDDRQTTPILLPFGRSRSKKAQAPRIEPAAAPTSRGRRRARPVPALEALPPRERIGIAARWFKRLDKSGAQQPPTARTNVTGVLRLTKSVFPIDWRTYFRQQFFGAAKWRRTEVSGFPADEALVSFEVTIDGRYLATHTLKVSHAPHREAAQANVTTVLHWDDLMPELRANNYTGYWVVLARTDDGRYQLSVQKEQPAA